MESLFKQIRRRAFNYADKRCTKIRQGKIPYFREIRKALGAVMALQVILARIMLKGRRSRPRTKEQNTRIIKKFEYDGPVHFDTLEEATKALHLAHKEYNKLRPNAKEVRDIYLSQLAIELEEEDGIKAAVHLHVLKHHEKIKQGYDHMIKLHEKKHRGSGVSVIEKMVDGERIQITNKNDIEQEIARCNKDKLLQANNTPSLREELLLSLLGEQGDFDTCWE